MSNTCIPRKKLRSAKLFTLDSCGRIIKTGKPVLDWLGFESISWKDEIDAGERELIVGVDGKPCVDDTSCPIDRGDTFTLNECTENDTLAALTGFGTLTSTLGATDGFDRLPYDCGAAVALELIFDTPSLCSGGAAKCVGMLVPFLTNWATTGTDKTVNGKTTVRGGYTALTKLNARLIDNFETVPGTPGAWTLPAELDHWSPWVDDIASGTQWYLKRVIDCPADTVKSCDTRAIVLV